MLIYLEPNSYWSEITNIEIALSIPLSSSKFLIDVEKCKVNNPAIDKSRPVILTESEEFGVPLSFVSPSGVE